jgi:Protein of unknown function (DUF3618)
MGRKSEQLERDAEGIRSELAASLAELRLRVTPGQIVDQLADYAREGPAADFLRNLAREIRENPIPVLLITIGIAWLAIAASRPPGTAWRIEGKLQGAPVDEIGVDIITPADASPKERSLTLAAGET